MQGRFMVISSLSIFMSKFSLDNAMKPYVLVCFHVWLSQLEIHHETCQSLWSQICATRHYFPIFFLPFVHCHLKALPVHPYSCHTILCMLPWKETLFTDITRGTLFVNPLQQSLPVHQLPRFAVSYHLESSFLGLLHFHHHCHSQALQSDVVLRLQPEEGDQDGNCLKGK